MMRNATDRRRVASLSLLPAAALGWAAAMPFPVASAQMGDASDVKIKVSEVANGDRLIRVPVNKGVLVDFSVPVKEVRVTKADIAEVAAVSPRQILLTGKSFGTTQLLAWLSDTEQRVFDVAVDIELDRLQASIRTAVPRADVRAHAVLDSVVLSGSVPDAAAAQRVMEVAGIYAKTVVNHIQVSGVQQVLLRVTIAEVNRSAVRQLGFNGWLAGDNFNDIFAVNQLDGINPVNIGAAREFGPIGELGGAAIPFATDRTEGLPLRTRPSLSVGFPRVQMQIFIQALRENGLLRVLAEPNLLAISGQEASFLAGGEVPIPIATDERIKIDYKEFGARLVFTPAVIGEGKIRLRVAPELSEPDLSNAVTVSGISVPGFITRRVETVVELGSGQTFAIGGLLSERVRGITRKIPALGEVPVLGPLFSSVEFQRDQTELVVLVTPELIDPISPDQVTYIPGQEHVDPNDFELYLLGKLDGAADNGMPRLQPRLNHSWPVRPEELYGESASLKLRGPLGPAGSDEGS